MLTADSRRAYDQMICTVCGACPTGCGIKFYVQAGRVVDVLGDEAHPVNRGALCARGSAVFQHFDHPARLRQPGLRQSLDQEFAPCSWDEALTFAAGRLQAIASAHGPDAVAVAAADPTDAASRVGAALFANAFGARALATSAPARPAPDTAAVEVFGVDAAPELTVPAGEWPQRACLLLIGGDPAVDYPVAFRHVLDARARHVPVLAAAPRFTATLAKADFGLALRPGSEAVFAFALFKVAGECGSDTADLEALLPGLEAWKAAAHHLSWETIERLTGQPQAAVQRAGLLWAGHQPGVIVVGAAGTPNLARALAGLLAVARAAHQADQAAGWNWLADPPWPFASVAQAADTPRAVVGSGDFWPQSAGGEGQPELVVHFGAYPDATQQHAHVTLPAASWAEVADLHVGHDRRVQWQVPVVQPPGQARNALEFWTALAERLGLDGVFPWRTADGRLDAVACAEALLSGPLALDGEACREAGGAVWPGRTSVPAEGAARPTLSAPPDLAVPEPDPGHPLILCRDVPAEGQAVWWSWLHAGESPAVFGLNPAVAAALEIATDDLVWVDDGRRRLAGRARISPAVPLWTIWASAGVPVARPVVVCRQQDHMARSLARLRALFAQIGKRA